MYEYIKGIYMGFNKEYIVIENNGMGYKIYTSGSTMAKMPKKNESVTIYTIQIVREDFIGLYGFLTKEELELFNLVLTVSGVGPKAALSLLSINNVDNLKRAIVMGDEKIITKAPGIGKKIAKRIILEIKDKIELEDDMLQQYDEDKNQNDKIVKEALEALIALGYTEREAKRALNNVDKTEPIENIIKNCLKSLMN
ncbi:Holliday junction branch migration protein RuvA [Haloimpatiens sp. FM7330]|uniref:Holliday junction branch migration protein RuvA n=1 Tax=Haloimpatiens sp. FM7330 TaxID=3298610 RepID=UPI00362813CD